VRAQPRQPSQAADEATQAAEALAKDVVRELLSLMDVRADVMAVDNPSAMPIGSDDPLTVFVDIMGRDLGMLIGRRGENLSQLQYMVNLLANKRSDEWIRVILDVEGYRSHREESLIGLAERVARQVARNRRPISLEPMPPNERRIVHMTLKEMPDVRTESSGEGDMRRVTIYPQ
jgi:spoIIIJ-associated protein